MEFFNRILKEKTILEEKFVLRKEKFLIFLPMLPQGYPRLPSKYFTPFGPADW